MTPTNCMCPVNGPRTCSSCKRKENARFIKLVEDQNAGKFDKWYNEIKKNIETPVAEEPVFENSRRAAVNATKKKNSIV